MVFGNFESTQKTKKSVFQERTFRNKRFFCFIPSQRNALEILNEHLKFSGTPQIDIVS